MYTGTGIFWLGFFIFISVLVVEHQSINWWKLVAKKWGVDYKEK